MSPARFRVKGPAHLAGMHDKSLRKFLPTLGLALASWLVWCPAAAAVRGPTPPNILLIVSDDQGFHDASFRGSAIETPRIDELAREGVVLSRFYTAPMCTPTRAALMTGRSPIRSGLNHGTILPWTEHGLDEQEPTLAERFREAGYQTALIGKWHLGHTRSHHHPIARGFDLHYGTLQGAIHYDSHRSSTPDLDYLDWSENGIDVVEDGYATTLLGSRAARFIESRDVRRPFFLVLSFTAPHKPKEAPDDIVAKYKAMGLSAVDSRHAAQLHVMDREIGRVLDTLQHEKIDDRTLVVFLSDNGATENGGGSNSPLRGWKGGTYDGAIRVLAIMRWHGILPANEVSEQLLRDFDLFPTLKAAAGLPRTAPTDGMNAWPVLRGAKLSEREAFFFRVSIGNPGMAGPCAAAIEGRFKLVQRCKDRSGSRRWSFLYDLIGDPAETIDLRKEHPEIVQALSEKLAAWEALYPSDGLLLSREPPPEWKAPASSIYQLMRDHDALLTLERPAFPRPTE